MRQKLFQTLAILAVFSCQSQVDPVTLFEEIPPSASGITFANSLTFDEEFNIFTYRNFYNGGGVALGDVNKDGLLDIYLTSNLGENKLYLNKGDFQFEDVTSKAGVAGTRAWSTGVAMADVNGDGLLDIYVCNSGDISGDNKQNELFINQGDGTFSEEAEIYGLADQGFSTHAVFFDYDKDGDLDVYLLNNSYQAIGSFNKMQNERLKRDSVGGDKLFRNDAGKFTDVSEEAGIYGSIIGFGLGITVGDLNQDTWPDIFISNDFFEKDYLYINNQDGTFTESLEQSMRSISTSSMGADIADINGDGLLDVFVTDMLPEQQERLKQVTTFENWDNFLFNKTHGYHYQFSRNMLHINNGDGTFSEMGRLANLEATDWSWGALIFDMDNDGRRDLFVANGIYQDITDLDYLNFIDDDETKIKIISQQDINYKALVDPIPSTPVSNYAYKNLGDLKFENLAESWGLGEAMHSNGAAYGDLNNDGALDLVVNNVNRPVSIFKNQSKTLNPANHYIQLELIGKGMNTEAIGAQVKVATNDQLFYAEQMPNRGFESSVDPKLTIGLGNQKSITEITVLWPDGKYTKTGPTQVDQLLTLSWENATLMDSSVNFFERPETSFFQPAPAAQIDFAHEENPMVDFDRDRLTFHMYSTEGPAFAQGDVNGDGIEDLFFGGARGFEGKLYLGDANGSFHFSAQKTFSADALSEDTDALFFDANADGFLDLIVASGGNESSLGAPELINRLYLNDGAGNFSKSKQPGFETNRGSTAVIRVIDLNADGAPDLFVGGRLVPFDYGAAASSGIFMNDGNGNFIEQTTALAPALSEIGMITDAQPVDWDQDGYVDLVLVGEWSAPVFFKNTGEKLEKIEMPELDKLKGWYRTLAVADLDENGFPDLILGNNGLNSRFKTSPENPIKMYLNDFDQNGSIEHIFVRENNGVQIPYTLKHELERQIPSIKKKYMRYSNYNNQTLTDIFPSEVLDRSIVNEINNLESGVLMNAGKGDFSWKPFPRMAQRSYVFAVSIVDLNEDGNLDLILGGNLFQAKPEFGKYDASYGDVLLGNGDGTFEYWRNAEHGLKINGDVRAIAQLGDGRILIVKNSAAAEIWEY
ncbi:VCBS repeat-containing protein [Algoriphagus halophytocola]|uniref:VCBS repeat-containing protein n=1 Tax=Algoriphagus halophytocola TaxID=2991499 RepID=A0ABY6MEA1_9BACT|nr:MULTISPECIES: VCBS repeat-containing protein [unclassified Algoriphagus]UZD22101.1 VCBS repeat-containing protein [Algoriphagus sp. TR-M5]WBL43352.1 VCBS repeat-containing protein [Algoriphagus sp. TR-M9]